ncbi:helix-turn-helix domain-containing protein [Riemerella columbipharyngis]|uniref:AraC-type DNA-binding protein n=1 Tax=Riemerella columbipharyngis TaxID=1071918 RepID=A0A1G7EJ51_9FLAO|nr:AraC family transcriptional regulator [Riemerella columbipharyngis]SDE63709.1 AraC-type DNA-binding protein [Riemerella columbipharyngis]
MLRKRIHRPSKTQNEAIIAIMQLISLNLIEIQEQHIDMVPYCSGIFAAFLQLVHQHYKAHHDLLFYADKLHMSTTYLSRIVKKMNGHTVVDFTHQTLASETAIKLKTINLTITQLADEFHFSDQSAFTKFFTRMKGVFPKDYRKNKLNDNIDYQFGLLGTIR